MKTPQSKPSHAETKLRMPQALMAELREQYAQTYPQHRLSMNAWLLMLIALAGVVREVEGDKPAKSRKGKP